MTTLLADIYGDSINKLEIACNDAWLAHICLSPEDSNLMGHVIKFMWENSLSF